MYKVTGADGIEYGLVSGEKIREWIKEGRVNLDSKVQSDGNVEWKALREYSEFADLRGTAPSPSLPPVLPVANASSRVSRLAIASLVLGILGILTVGITAVFGLVLGIFALVKINSSRGELRGRGIAVAGTIISGFLVLILPAILAAMLLPALGRAKARAQSILCMNNMKQLALGGMMYAGDNKDRFPPGDHWCDLIGKYVGNQNAFRCPAADSSQSCHYAFNEKLSGLEIKIVRSPAQTVLMFETDSGWNLSGGPGLVLNRPRHRDTIGLVFADGHCEMATRGRLRAVRWDP